MFLKKTKSMLLVLFLGLTPIYFIGCAPEAADTPEEPGDGEIVMEETALSLSFTVGSEWPGFPGVEKFVDLVSERTDGKVQVNLHPGAELGSERETYEGMQAGTVDMVLNTNGPLPGFLDEGMLLDLPFLFPDYETADVILGGPAGDKLIEIIEDKMDIVVLAWGENGFRHFTNSRRLINSPEDLSGLRIRTMENPLMRDTIEILGADPTTIAGPEIYTSLQQGVVDGQENPLAIIKALAIYEVQDYLTLSGHFYSPLLLAISADKFYSFPEDVQDILRTSAKESMEYKKEIMREADQEVIEFLEKEGMEITEITDEERIAFVEVTEPIFEQYQDKIGEELVNLIIDELEAIGAR